MPLQLDPTVITETDLLTLHNEHTVAEEHVVPAAGAEFLSTYTIPASGIVALREKPKQQQLTVPTGTTVTEVPGGPFVEVLTTPAAGQFSVNYINGTVTFNAADIGKNVLISYTALGSVVRAQHINNINVPLISLYNRLNALVPEPPAPQDFTFPNDVTITGDLNVIGIINKLATEVLNFSDNILLLNSGQADDGAPILNVGIEIDRSGNPQGDLTHPQFFWNESDLTWSFNSTSGGPTGTRAPLFKVYDKGGVQTTRLTTVQETTLTATLVVADGGLFWFNTDTSQFMGWNGSSPIILG